MKRYFFLAVFFLFAVNLYSVEFVESASPKSNSYVMYVNPCDFGPVVDKVVLHTEFLIGQEEVKPEDFDITVYANPKDSVVVYGIVKGGRKLIFLMRPAIRPFRQRVIILHSGLNTARMTNLQLHSMTRNFLIWKSCTTTKLQTRISESQ